MTDYRLDSINSSCRKLYLADLMMADDSIGEIVQEFKDQGRVVEELEIRVRDSRFGLEKGEGGRSLGVSEEQAALMARRG